MRVQIAILYAFADRNDAEAIQGLDGSLRAGIEAADRFHRVADELDADRQLFAGREHVEDAAATREFAMRIDRIGGLVPAEHERVRELVRIDVDAWLDLVRGQ